LKLTGSFPPIEIKKTASPASQLTDVFKILDRANIERGKAAVLCLKDELMAFDNMNYIISIWLI
jgi:hypothetical protein